ncbi:MAG: AsmA family protein [Pseudomonadota bacterium]|nr:AsmA family protein [Pseudomonadota bacterium]MDO7710005.1 AsmA family protein [Pseudomonadota bacterium]
MRILFKFIIFIVILVIAGLIALLFIVDPNDYKQEISSQVEKATGRTLTLDGDIKLSVFPWIALELGPLSLSNAAGFKADSFAKVQAAEIRIKLMPLLKKQLEMDTIILDGLALNLETNKVGKTNWDDLVPKNDASTDTTKKADASSNDTPTLAAISIAGVKLTNANILWSDATTAENYQLQNFNLNTDPLVPGKPTALDMEFDVASTKPQAQAHIKLDTKVMVDLENQQYTLTGLNLTTQISGKELPFSQSNLTLSGDINADMVKQLVNIDDLTLSAEASNDKQAIDAKLSAQISSNLATQQSTIKGLVLSAEVLDPSLPNGKAKLNITADISTDMKQQTLTLSALIINAYDLLISGDIKTSKLLSDNPNFVGNIIVKPFNLRQLANNLNVELPVMADDSTLKLVQLTTEFEGSTKHINAKQLNVTLDQSKLSGSLAINNFAKPAFDFKLNLDEIDADRYLPPATKTEAPKANAPASTSASAELPLEALRQINAKGTLDIGKLTISGTHSEKIHIEINATNGLINLSPMSANMYEGQYQGNVGLDARGKTLKLSLNESLKGVKVGPLLKDLTDDDKLSGMVNAQAKLTGNGATILQIKQTLSGNGNFSFTDGAVKGINIAESIRKAKATLKGETLPASDAPLQTDFSNLSGSFTATDGIIDNQDLLAMSPLLRINGAGKIDLPKEGIDYGLKVSIVETSSGQGGKALADLKGLTIPVKITGTFSNPKPTVDLASMLKERATDEVKAKVADKLKDKLGGDLGDLLGGALAPKPAVPVTEPTTEPSPAEPTTEPAPEKTPEDQLKDAVSDKLKGFF